MIEKSADPDANIIIGAVIDENLNDELVITVIATGFDKSDLVRKDEKIAASTKTTKTSKTTKTTYAEKPVASIEIAGDELDIPTFLRRNRFR